jgi:hypothetical protein
MNEAVVTSVLAAVVLEPPVVSDVVVSSDWLPDRLFSMLASDACADDGRLETSLLMLEPSSDELSELFEFVVSVACKTLRANWAEISRVEERAVTMARLPERCQLGPRPGGV